MKGKLTQKVNIAVIAALGVLAVVGVGYASWPSSKKAAASASRQPDERGSACSNVIVEPRERVV